MPYFIEKQEDKYCVVKGTRGKEGNETVKCHPTPDAAKKHLAALMVNVSNPHKAVTAPASTGNMLHGRGGLESQAGLGADELLQCKCPECGKTVDKAAGTPCSEKSCPECGAKMRSETAEKFAYKNVGGDYRVYKAGEQWRWLAISSTAILDREAEIVTEKAYDDAIAYAREHNDYGELDLVHVDGTEIGDCDLMVRARDKLIEGGTFRNTTLAQKVRARIQEQPDDDGVSIKFRYDPTQFDGVSYLGGIQIMKRAVLPYDMAASYGTAIAAVQGGKMAKSIDEATKAALLGYGVTEEQLADLIEKQKSLPEEPNVKFKENEPWHEDEGMTEKAVWSTAMVNDLPDSCFLYVEEGEKEDGKTTPRSKRHLPYKNAQGKVDLPHLRNAISRLGQSGTGKGWLSADLRKRLIAKAQGILRKQGGGDRKEEKVDKQSLLDAVKNTIEGLFGSQEQQPEPVAMTPDVAEAEKSGTEVEQVSTEAQETEPVEKKETEFILSPEVTKQISAEAVKMLVPIVQKAMEPLINEIAELRGWTGTVVAKFDSIDKRLAEAEKDIETKVVQRIDELPPVVKVRMEEVRAAQVPGSVQTTVPSEKAADTPSAEFMKHVEALVGRMMGGKDDYKV